MRRSTTALAAAAALTASGCSSDFLPPSYLNDLRVLALIADPLEVGPAQSLSIRPAIYRPPGSDGLPVAVTQRWTFCPLSAGSVSGYACAVPQCEVTLCADPPAGSAPACPADGSVTASPGTISLACLAAAGGGGTVPGQAPDVVQTVFRYQVASSTGQSRDAVLQIPLWTKATPDPATINQPPFISSVTIGGVTMAPGSPVPPLAPGGALPVRVVVTQESAQPYVDAAGVGRVETITAYTFSTAGRMAFDSATGIDTTVDLQGSDLSSTDVAADVYVVVVDLRGGQAVAGPFTVPIQP